MPKKGGTKRDSIFDSTDSAPKAKKPAAAKAKTEEAPKAVKVEAGDDFTFDRFKVLKTLLKTHEAEVLYRKGKEDRMLVIGMALMAVLAFTAFLTRAIYVGFTGGGSWFYCLLFRTFFAFLIGVVGFSAAAMIELNRTRLQDLLAVIVKLHEKFKLFEDGAYGDGSFLPSPYKFIGSINDDETNYSLLILKVGAVIAAVAVFLLI